MRVLRCFNYDNALHVVCAIEVIKWIAWSAIFDSKRAVLLQKKSSHIKQLLLMNFSCLKGFSSTIDVTDSW